MHESTQKNRRKCPRLRRPERGYCCSGATSVVVGALDGRLAPRRRAWSNSSGPPSDLVVAARRPRVNRADVAEATGDKKVEDRNIRGFTRRERKTKQLESDLFSMNLRVENLESWFVRRWLCRSTDRIRRDTLGQSLMRSRARCITSICGGSASTAPGSSARGGVNSRQIKHLQMKRGATHYRR